MEELVLFLLETGADGEELLPNSIRVGMVKEDGEEDGEVSFLLVEACSRDGLVLIETGGAGEEQDKHNGRC